MKYFVVILLPFLLLSVRMKAQKPPIDEAAIANWPDNGVASLTKDGRYGFTLVHSAKGTVLSAKEIRGSWSSDFKISGSLVIPLKKDYVLFEQEGDSIILYNLIKKKIESVFCGKNLQGAAERYPDYVYWTVGQENSGGIVFYQSSTGKTRTVEHGRTVYFAPKANTVIVIKKVKDSLFEAERVDLDGQGSKVVWQGKRHPAFLRVSPSGYRAAMTVTAADGMGFEAVTSLANEPFKALNTGAGDFFLTTPDIRFSGDEKSVFFNREAKAELSYRNLPDTGVSVDVWHYRDEVIQDRQLAIIREGRLPAGNPVICNLETGIIKELTSSGDERMSPSDAAEVKKYYLVEKGCQEPDSLQRDIHLGGMRNILLRRIDSDSAELVAPRGYYNALQLSPDQRYVLYFDQLRRRYLLYTIATRTTRDISALVPADLTHAMHEGAQAGLYMPHGSPGWLAGDKGILLYDAHDIWLLEFDGMRPECLTKGAGESQGISLRFYADTNERIGNVFTRGQHYWLRGIRDEDYAEGFASFILGAQKARLDIVAEPVKNCYYYRFGSHFLVKRSTISTGWSWYYTRDFKRFSLLSQLLPSKDYNWVSKELLHFSLPDGKKGMGILFKPENFDSTRRYPVIFTYYETLSDKIYEYDVPEQALGGGAIDATWMASREYLVCQVDINFRYGFPGESAYEAVMSAADLLSSRSYIDTLHMGLSGVSHGATSTDYIVTRTGRFAAAAAGCGVSDMIASYGSLRVGAISRQFLYESGQERIGGTPWNQLGRYLENSAVLHADKVTTPMLILHNKEDYTVPWSQGLEWYMALRRLGKPSWMLQYDGEAHGVEEPRALRDFNLRQEQFFNHFLKGRPAPVWMSRGIPAKLKGRFSGLELENRSENR